MTNDDSAPLDRINKHDHLIAPWSDETVAALNRYQQAGEYHPYTCGNDAFNHAWNDRSLIATTDGWVCCKKDEGCGYTQNWAFPQTLAVAPPPE